jgi:hypothetical protein
MQSVSGGLSALASKGSSRRSRYRQCAGIFAVNQRAAAAAALPCRLTQDPAARPHAADELLEEGDGQAFALQEARCRPHSGRGELVRQRGSKQPAGGQLWLWAVVAALLSNGLAAMGKGGREAREATHKL